MPSEVRLSPKSRRAILQQLSRERRAELTAHFELAVTDRRSSEAHVDAIVRKPSLDFRQLVEMLRREELKAACEALGLDSRGREKAGFVERILAPGPGGEGPTVVSTTASPAPPPPNGHGEEALKSQLRRFVVETAGGFRGRDAAATFTSRSR